MVSRISIETAKEMECDCQFGSYTYQRDTILPNKTATVFGGLICNCSSRGLYAFPPSIQNMEQVVSLDLSKNNFSMISDWNLTRFTSLAFLDVTDNPITNIKPNTFTEDALTTLIELHSGPELVQKGFFQNRVADNTMDDTAAIPNLKRLVISQSGTGITKKRQGDILTTLPQLTIFKESLQELKISGIAINELPANFVDNFTRLESVVIEDIYVDKELNKETFVNLPLLYHFKLTRSEFITNYGLWASFLLFVPSLKVLNMATNTNMGGLDELLTKETKPLELDSLDLSFDKLNYLSLKYIYIVNINLRNNDMGLLKVRFENAWFQHLDVSNNSMTKFVKPGKFYKVDDKDDKQLRKRYTINKISLLFLHSAQNFLTFTPNASFILI